MSTAWFLSFLLALTHPVSPSEPIDDKGAHKLRIDNMAAFEAFTFLNNVRETPEAYAALVGIQPQEVAPYLPTLQLNPTLMRVAEQKAIDMAMRDYFSHTSPEGRGINYLMHQAGFPIHPKLRANPQSNHFESLAAGLPDGQSVIQALIKDEGVPSLSHRKHLLGQTDFFAQCNQVGIAFVRAEGRTFRTYCCIIIARPS